MKQFYILFFLSLIWIQSCQILEPRGPEPSFIIIDELNFPSNPDQGPPSQNINHVEIFFEREPIGIYEIPLKIAVIPTMEESELQIFPVINENGLTYAFTAYDMMNSVLYKQQFEVAEEYTFNPSFTYLDEATFALVETFENGNQFTFDVDGADSTKVLISQEKFANGANSGLMSVSSEEKIEVANDKKLLGLSPGKRAFIEIEHNASITFSMGLIGYSGSTDAKTVLIQFIPRNEWNKTYIDFSHVLNLGGFEEYRLFFIVDGNLSVGKVYIDNVKVLYK